MELDFSSITTLSPARIILGKYCSVLVLSLLVISLFFPFMTFAYFLRGIELNIILITLQTIFTTTIVLSSILLLLGSSRKKWTIFGIIPFLLVILSYFVFGFISMLIDRAYGVSSTGMDDGDVLRCMNWVVAPVMYLVFYVLTVSWISHEHANRMKAPRLLGLAMMALSIIGFGFVMAYKGNLEKTVVWLSLSLIYSLCFYMLVLALITSMERLKSGLRVWRDAPKGVLKRMGYFVVSSGAYGGVVFLWLYLLVLWILQFIAHTGSMDVDLAETFTSMAQLLAYVIFYLEMTLFLRTLLPKVKPYLCTILVCLVFSCLPFILQVLLAEIQGKAVDFLVYPALCATSIGCFFNDLLATYTECSYTFALIGFVFIAGEVWKAWKQMNKKELEK